MPTKKKTTKRKVKRYVPSFVITNGKDSFVYTLDVTPMTKKKVQEFDKTLQEYIASGSWQTSLALKEV